MGRAEQIRLLIAHGNPLVAAGLEVAFAAQPDFEVFFAEVTAGATQLARAALHRANVTITDCDTGLDLLRAQPRPACGIVIVTDDDSEASIRCAVELGANGYLLLSSSPAAVVKAVRGVCDGGRMLDPLVTAKMMASFAADPLTAREIEVLRLLMLGLSDKAVARALGRSLGTAKSHVKAILAKLNVASRTEAVVVARRRGLITRAQELPRPPLRFDLHVHSSAALVRTDAKNA